MAIQIGWGKLPYYNYAVTMHMDWQFRGGLSFRPNYTIQFSTDVRSAILTYGKTRKCSTLCPIDAASRQIPIILFADRVVIWDDAMPRRI